MTAYPELGVAAGACQGNGILLDITDPVNPVRLDAVSRPELLLLALGDAQQRRQTVDVHRRVGRWHERRAAAPPTNSSGAPTPSTRSSDGQMEFASYFKMPAVQTSQENCVAHNSSLVPVPGRDILVQAWYQGGISLIDFTDAADPVEIGVLRPRSDHRSANPTGLNLGGLWSTYWYNGNVYGTEIARGFDTFGLLESDMMSENELGAAKEYQVDEFNAQHQTEIIWAPSFNVAGSYFDQAVRAGTLDDRTEAKVGRHLAKAEKLAGQGRDGLGNRPAEQRDPAARRFGPARRARSTCATHYIRRA